MKRIRNILITLASLAILVTFIKPHTRDSQPLLNVQVADILSLKDKNDIQINMHTLGSPAMNFALQTSNIMKRKYLKAKASKDQKDLNVNILIDSYGGYVSTMYQIESLLNMYRGVGQFNFTCYVANAISAAFYLMVRVCDRTILIRGAEIAQHPVHVGREMSTASTLLITKDMSDAEAASLNQEENFWFSLTRKVGKLKYFSVDELFKYNIIDEVYNRE